MEQKLLHSPFDPPFATVVEQIVEKYWLETNSSFLMAWYTFLVEGIGVGKCKECKAVKKSYSSHVIVILVY